MEEWIELKNRVNVGDLIESLAKELSEDQMFDLILKIDDAICTCEFTKRVHHKFEAILKEGHCWED